MWRRKKARYFAWKEALAKWHRRSPAERWLRIEAFLLLGLARIMVVVLPFRILAATLGRHRMETDHQVSPPVTDLALKIGQAVRAAACHTPWKSVCLPQAVAAQWMLRRRGIAGTLYLGVAKDKTNPDKLTAHAWLRCGNQILTGAGGYQAFTVVTTFS
jgi:hypothetical protein